MYSSLSTIHFLVKIPEVGDWCKSNQFWQNLNRIGALFQSLAPFHNKKVKHPCSGIKSCILVCQYVDSLVFLHSKTLFPISKANALNLLSCKHPQFPDLLILLPDPWAPWFFSSYSPDQILTLVKSNSSPTSISVHLWPNMGVVKHITMFTDPSETQDHWPQVDISAAQQTW